MSFLKCTALSLLLCYAIIFPGHTQSNAEASKPLFFVNKKPVSVAEFSYLYRKNHQHKPEEFTKEKIEAYLQLFINYKLKVEEALSRGMDTTSTFRREYQTYRDELLKPYLPDANVIDSLVMLTYQRLREEINVSHILIQVAPNATPADTLAAYERITEVRNRALAGADFGALAGEFSEEPRAEETQGNLGFFTAMQMVFPFEQAAYTTPVGQISAPVRTRFGYHILKVHERRPSRGEVEVSHIMVRTAPNRDDLRSRNAIFDIYDKLQKGMSWEELCQQYSEDPNTKDTGGKLRPFGVGGMASAPEFQEIAFSLTKPGEISDPVRTQFGWHILRLESRIPLPPFEEVKPALTQRVSRDERVTISKAAIRQRMRTEYGFVENEPVKTKLWDVADSVTSGSLSTVESLLQEILFTVSGQDYQVNDFLLFLRGQPQPPQSTSATKNLDDAYARYTDHVHLRLVEEKVKQASPDYKWLLKEYYEGILLFEIMEQEVWSRAMSDSIGQRNYFDRNAAKYMAGERIAAKIYSAHAEEPLKTLQKMLAEGQTEVREFLAANRMRVDSGAFERNDRTIFSGVDWSPGLKMARQSGIYYLIEIEKILPPGPKTFTEARASVISDYQTFLEDSWISELKRKFGVKVDKKAKKNAFEALVDQTDKLQ